MRLLLSVVCFVLSLPSGATAGPKEEALEVVDKWTKAFAASDVDAIVSLTRLTRCSWEPGAKQS